MATIGKKKGLVVVKCPLVIYSLDGSADVQHSIECSWPLVPYGVDGVGCALYTLAIKLD